MRKNYVRQHSHLENEPFIVRCACTYLFDCTKDTVSISSSVMLASISIFPILQLAHSCMGKWNNVAHYKSKVKAVSSRCLITHCVRHALLLSAPRCLDNTAKAPLQYAKLSDIAVAVLGYDSSEFAILTKLPSLVGRVGTLTRLGTVTSATDNIITTVRHP